MDRRQDGPMGDLNVNWSSFLCVHAGERDCLVKLSNPVSRESGNMHAHLCNAFGHVR